MHTSLVGTVTDLNSPLPRRVLKTFRLTSAEIAAAGPAKTAATQDLAFGLSDVLAGRCDEFVQDLGAKRYTYRAASADLSPADDEDADACWCGAPILSAGCTGSHEAGA